MLKPKKKFLRGASGVPAAIFGGDDVGGVVELMKLTSVQPSWG